MHPARCREWAADCEHELAEWRMCAGRGSLAPASLQGRHGSARELVPLSSPHSSPRPPGPCGQKLAGFECCWVTDFRWVFKCVHICWAVCARVLSEGHRAQVCPVLDHSPLGREVATSWSPCILSVTSPPQGSAARWLGSSLPETLRGPPWLLGKGQHFRRSPRPCWPGPSVQPHPEVCFLSLLSSPAGLQVLPQGLGRLQCAPLSHSPVTACASSSQGNSAPCRPLM